MIEFVVFRVFSPLQAWGEIAPGEERTSWQVPSHSAIVGFLGGALGLERSSPDLARLHSKLCFAVRVEGRKQRSVADFHTTQVATGAGRRLNRAMEVWEATMRAGATILSNREYLQDAIFAVAIWYRDGESVSGLCEALQVPKFIPYLGRKSCPLALPVGATLIEAQTAAQALYQFGGPPSWLRRIASLPGEEVEVRTDQHSCSGFDPERLHLRRDRCIDPVQRLFVEREEIIARTKMPN